MTGAPVPTGATAIVPVEATDGGVASVQIRQHSEPGKHIRRAGEDVAAGTAVLRAGQVVTPATLGLAAALGLAELTATPRQRVLVISTGAELVSPGTPLPPGQIYESNAIMLAAAVSEAGADVVATQTVGDDVAEFTGVLDQYAAEADLIITSGGVSAGAYEVVKDAFGRSARRSGRAIRQGGHAARHAAGRRPRGRHTDRHAARQSGQCAGVLRGVHPPCPPRGHGPPGAVPAAPDRGAARGGDLAAGKRQFRRAVLATTTEGGVGQVTSYGPPASHHLRWLASANALIDIPEDVVEVPAGTELQVWDLS